MTIDTTGLPYGPYTGKLIAQPTTGVADVYFFTFTVAPTCTAPVVAIEPVSLIRTAGNEAEFSVAATGTGLTYQWFKGEALIQVATSSTYTIPSVLASDAGAYSVMVSNDCGEVTSHGANLSVNLIPTQITWNNPAPIIYGTGLDGTQLNATASVDGNFVYQPDWGTVLESGMGQTLRVDFTPDDFEKYALMFKMVTIDVLPADQTINLTLPDEKTYGEEPFTVTASATSGLPVALSASGACSISGSTLSLTGAGTCEVTASQTGDGNHNPAAPVTKSFAVKQATPVVTAIGSDCTFNGSACAGSGSASGVTGSLPVTLAYNTPDGNAPVNAGKYVLTVSFAGDVNHLPGSAVAEVIIHPATPSIQVTGGSFTYDGQPHAASVTVTGAGGLSLTPDPVYSGNCTQAPVNVIETPCVASYQYPGDANHEPSNGLATITITERFITVTADSKEKVLNGPDPALTYQITTGGLVTGDAFMGFLTRDSGEAIGAYPITQGTLSLSSNYALTFVGATFKIVYATGAACPGSRQVLQPINADGSSVFKKGSTVPVKFRVCDANGVSVGTAGVVDHFWLVKTQNGTVLLPNETPVSTTPDTAFRWSPTDQQWIFNLNTKNLTAGITYTYHIFLNDDTIIEFKFGLK